MTPEERRPYPGLRSFTRKEADLFFGRDGAVDEMVGRLGSRRFLAVLGPSGAGKSSLVSAGLLPALQAGLLHRARSDWHFAEMRPGDRPFFNLAEALLSSGEADASVPLAEEQVASLAERLAEGSGSILAWHGAEGPAERTNLLLFVDAFEELFSSEDARAEAEAFVEALLASAAAPLEEARIYVVVAMRAEYLGAAACIEGLAEAIDEGNYLAPPLSRNQLRNAIQGPATICDFEVAPALVDRLIEDVAGFAPEGEAGTGHALDPLVGRADRLPLMQHALSLLWSMASDRAQGDTPVLTLTDYEAVGGLSGALDTHGRDLLEALLPEHQGAVPHVFRALVEGESLGEAVGRPTPFGELVEMAHDDEIAVREIVEAFRAPGHDFLTPPRPEPLTADTPVGLCHASLIRQWDAYGKWLQQEIAAASVWKRLRDWAGRHEDGAADLALGADLAKLAEWWDRERPSAAWAARYGGDLDLVNRFLEKSRRAQAAADRAETERRGRKVRNQLLAFAAVVTVCIVTPLAVFTGYTAVRANQEAEHAKVAEVAAADAREVAAKERESALEAAELADEAREQAEADRARADQEQLRAEEERQRALAAREEATATAEQLEAERARTEEERMQALAAIEKATAAGLQRDEADAERREAIAARDAAVLAVQQAESERDLALLERQRALDAQESAEANRQRAERARVEAVTAREAALEQVAAAEAARDDALALAAAAETTRDNAQEEQRQALAAAEAAEAAKRKADEERLAVEIARDRALEERQQALAAAEAADAARQKADEERLAALAARDQALKEREQALAAVEAAEAAKQKAGEERLAALTARDRALEEREQALAAAEAAEADKHKADEERLAALTARDRALEERQQALAAVETAEADKQKADEARFVALGERGAALQQASAAEAALAEAEEQRTSAIAARDAARAAADDAEALADKERLRALAAVDQASEAEAELERVREALASAEAALETAAAEKALADEARLAAQGQPGPSPEAEPLRTE